MDMPFLLRYALEGLARLNTEIQRDHRYLSLLPDGAREDRRAVSAATLGDAGGPDPLRRRTGRAHGRRTGPRTDRSRSAGLVRFRDRRRAVSDLPWAPRRTLSRTCLRGPPGRSA